MEMETRVGRERKRSLGVSGKRGGTGVVGMGMSIPRVTVNHRKAPGACSRCGHGTKFWPMSGKWKYCVFL